MNASARVYGVLLLGVTGIGVSPLLIRLGTDAPSLALVTLRTVFAALLLLPVALPKVTGELRAFSAKDWGAVIGAGVFLGLHLIAWFESLYHTSVASATVLVTMSPLFIAILGYFFLGERLSRRLLFSILLGIGGASLIAFADVRGGVFPNALLGNGLAFGAALLVSVYLLIGRVVRRHASFLAYLLPLYVVVALVTLAFALVRGVDLLQPPEVLLLCLAMAILPSLIGHGSLNYAVKYVSPALIGLLSLTEPLISTIGAFFLFKEVPAPLAILGMALVLVSLGVVFLKKKTQPTTQPTVEESTLQTAAED